MIETVLIGLALAVIIYLAFRILKLAIRTTMIGAIGGLTYVGLVYLEYATFSISQLLLAMFVFSGGYLLYKIIQIPIWFGGKIRNFIFGKN